MFVKTIKIKKKKKQKKQKVSRHGNRFAARVRRRYFSEGEKRRPEMRPKQTIHIDSSVQRKRK